MFCVWIDVNAVPAAGRHTQFFIYKFPGSARSVPQAPTRAAGPAAPPRQYRCGCSAHRAKRDRRPAIHATKRRDRLRLQKRRPNPAKPLPDMPPRSLRQIRFRRTEQAGQFPQTTTVRRPSRTEPGASHPNISAISAPLHTICAFSERISALVPSAQRSPTRPGTAITSRW